MPVSNAPSILTGVTKYMRILMGTEEVGASNPIPTGGNVAHDAADSGSPVKIGGYASTTAPTAVTAADRVNAWFSLNGAQHVTPASGTSVQTMVSTPSDGATNAANMFVQASRGQRFNGTSWDLETYATTVSRIMSAANTTNATSAKGSAGKVFRISGLNAAAAVRYVKVYNKATAPTVGTDTPVLTLACAASVPFSFDLQPGMYFSLGIAYALTTGAADADTGALTAGDILGLNVIYA